MRWDRLPARIRQATGAALLTLLGSLCSPETAMAQPQIGNLLPNPRLSVVTPGGGKVGTSVEVVCTGLDIEQPKELVFSHPGIKAVFEAPPEPAKPDPKNKKPMPPPKRRRGPMGTPGVARFKVTIAPDVPVGLYDVRLVNAWGISNPRAFAVGDLAEVTEKEPNNDVEQAQRVEINTTVNGTISAGTDVDFYAFAAKKGQRVVVSCLALSLDSRLDPDLELFDPAGKLIAANRQYQGSDSVLDATIPEDGDYVVRVCQFTYTQGGPEYYYRLSITTAPWIDAVYPPMVEPGKTAKVTVYGRNLPGGKLDDTARIDGRPLEKVEVEIKAPAEPLARQRLAYRGRKEPPTLSLDGFEYRIRNESGTSNPFLMTYAKAPVVLDNRANDTPETAQEVTLPCEIAGQIEKRRDRDWYTFTAKKGDLYHIEVISDRLGAPTDMYFILRNPTTKQNLAEVDQNSEVLTTNFKFYAMTEDPGVYVLRVPADGQYQLMVTSRTADTLSGPRHFYRVRITPPEPDFHVVLMPPDSYRQDSCCVHQGGTNFYTAFAWRHDGWAGDITLTAVDLPKGVTCPPQTIGAGVKTTKIAVSAAADAPPWSGLIKFKATASIGGKPVEREARYASISWPVPPQQNIPMFVRMDEGLALAVREKAPFHLTATIDKATVVQGDKPTVTFKLDRYWPDFKGQLSIVPSPREIPNNLLTFPQVNIPGNQANGKTTLNINTGAQPGTYTLVFRCFAPVPYNKDPMAKARPSINVVQCSTPVVLTILPKQVARVSLNNQNPTIKIGKQAEIRVRVDRLFGYDGEFKVQLVLPPNTQGISAAEVTIPAGQTEGVLVVKAADDAKPGNRGNLTLKTTALYNGKVPLTNEAKVNVNIVK